MKKLLYTLAFTVIGFTASYAQKVERVKSSPEQRAERSAVAMQKKLNLTEDQKTKIQKIELDKFKQYDQWRKEDGEAMKKKMEGRKVVSKSHQDKVDAILTPEQRKTFESNKAERAEKMKNRTERKDGRKHNKRSVDKPTTEKKS